MSSNTPHNMVSSSEVRSSIQKARVSELVKERTVERLKSAEGGAAVETAVDLHNKALRLVLGRKMVAGICLSDVSLEDVSALMDEASSGSDVPTATTVRPMTRSLTPSVVAMVTAPQTSRRELSCGRRNG